jgi:hypothetical protein
MHLPGLRVWSSRVAAGVAVLSVTVLAAPAALAQASTGPVSSTPAPGTPHLGPFVSGHTEQIRQLVQCGGTMYAVGRFTPAGGGIVQRGTTYARNNVFSFSATAPYKITSWAPDVNGIVNTIAFSGGNCADAYIGGLFTTINGTAAKDIAEISTTTGNVVPAFGHNASGQVETILATGGHLLTGGYFKSIDGSSADPYFASLNPQTGKDDGYLSLNISGNNQFPGVTSNPTRVYNQQLSPDGTKDLVEGDFSSVGGQGRLQIFMLDLTTSPASLLPWSSPEWDGSKGYPPDGYYYQCSGNVSFYIQAAAWSPDGNTVYIATTGTLPWNHPQSGQQVGLCDVAAAFPATPTDGAVLQEWVNYTGCDSLYSVAADASYAYFGGHERWANNPDGCNSPGPGAITVRGFEGIPVTGPDTGLVTPAFNPTRARGLGADDMLLTSAGLWIASDNFHNADACAHKNNYSGICFLPYS